MLKLIAVNLAPILFVMVLYLTLYTDQAVLYAGTIYVLVDISVFIFRLALTPDIWRSRVIVLQKIIYNSLMGLSAYENDIKYFAIGLVAYHALIAFACWWLQRKNQYFVELYETRFLGPISRLEQMGVIMSGEHRNSYIKAVNELYLRNMFILTCLYIVILPAVNLETAGWYTFLSFICIAIVNWLLVLNLTVRVFKYFRSNINIKDFELNVKRMQQTMEDGVNTDEMKEKYTEVENFLKQFQDQQTHDKESLPNEKNDHEEENKSDSSKKRR
ncbi:hypothetical protein [Psittacicella gerlachiana]|uniref:Uncharacterized protein n=1 Tax=Psittacicella gerlachiana TaxID=2028574 RepID=A0A3A1Y7T9_9GAMM|nr:hypothetical protein [Psittacicella gerlachiana]RIY34363.1 hypothetical protein CKF59_05535 [Psittacicella gerlachiana]